MTHAQRCGTTQSAKSSDQDEISLKANSLMSFVNGEISWTIVLHIFLQSVTEYYITVFTNL